MLLELEINGHVRGAAGIIQRESVRDYIVPTSMGGQNILPGLILTMLRPCVMGVTNIWEVTQKNTENIK